jgi:hypothetical protein
METEITQEIAAPAPKSKKADKVVADVAPAQILREVAIGIQEFKAVPLVGGGWQHISSTDDGSFHTSAYEISAAGCLVDISGPFGRNVAFVPGSRIDTKNGVKYIRNN